jgi:hypothetical protein
MSRKVSQALGGSLARQDHRRARLTFKPDTTTCDGVVYESV